MTSRATGIFFRRALFCGLLGSGWCWAASPPEQADETIIFIRHGEKPAQGLGQINCQGLNRALALPTVLLAQFGRPDFVFAADPHEKKRDGEQPYNYVRPLLTVAPTAVQLGLPINTSFGYADINGLQKELAEPRYHHARVLVAWEHRKLEDLVKAMLRDMGGEVDMVPHWKSSDFDSIYVVTVRRSEGRATASFALAHQGLDGQDPACAGALPAPRTASGIH